MLKRYYYLHLVTLSGFRHLKVIRLVPIINIFGLGQVRVNVEMEDDISGALTCTNNRMLGLLEEEGETRERLPRGIQLYKKIHPRQQFFLSVWIQEGIILATLKTTHGRTPQVCGTCKTEQEIICDSLVKRMDRWQRLEKMIVKSYFLALHNTCVLLDIGQSR